MASRRTRIKGIANIPQRRKTNNGSIEEEVPIENIGNEKNLTIINEHNLNCGEPINETPAVNFMTDTENVENIPQGFKAHVAKNEVQKAKTPETLPVARRKFIKPTISVNSLSRKNKVEESTKNENKIVVLNEVISFATQNEPIVLNQNSDSYIVNNSQHSSTNTIDDFVRETKILPARPIIQTTDVEYPIPPPSPNKINRSRIKAIPRLGQRHISFSASESEDESRRNYRHRNDSVCSSTSGLQDNNSIADCPSPQKPREFNSVIQRKCRRTEQSRKLAEARRDFYLKFGDKKPDRQKLTMIDLIFYNPLTNPMSNDTKKREHSENVDAKEEESEKIDDPDSVVSDEENEIPAPQIKIGPEGEIIVDEKSLVIENKAVKRNREQIEKSKIVNGNFDTGYGVYKRAKRSKDWNKQETLKFYKALNTLGTDFTLMCELFPRRSRRELKQKFKKEERINKALVDKAIMNPCGFEYDDFKHEVDMEEKELRELDRIREREKVLKEEAKKRKTELTTKQVLTEKSEKSEPKHKKKKKNFDIFDVLDDESDTEVSEIESLDEETDRTALNYIQKPTRSGRIPKLLGRFKPPEIQNNNSIDAQPGSLIVVAGTGCNGQPVYKVCMITGENGREQIGDDMHSLQKALESKENSIASLFTISATTTENDKKEISKEENVTIAEENNVTIPADDHIYTLKPDISTLE